MATTTDSQHRPQPGDAIMESAAEAAAVDVHARACQLRVLLRELAEPGGLTRSRLGELAAWLDGPAWRLLEDHHRALAEVARR